MLTNGGSIDLVASSPLSTVTKVYSSSVAIIGSFRQHYEQVLEAWQTFVAAGLIVTSPKGDPIVMPGIPFVRFTSDNEKHSDPMVQTIALHRIMSASFTYVVAPDGYVGRTTCYEIGRLLQAGLPVYFSQIPEDLPLRVPPAHLASPAELVARFIDEPAEAWHSTTEHLDDNGLLERDLLTGRFRDL